MLCTTYAVWGVQVFSNSAVQLAGLVCLCLTPVAGCDAQQRAA